MKKRMAMAGLVLGTALALSACGGGDEASPAPASETASGTVGGAAGEAKTFAIKATNFKFEANEIRVKKGDQVTISLENAQGNHAMKIEGYDLEVKGGQSVTFTADRAGEFAMPCSIMCGAGHKDMVAKLIVE